MADAAGATKLQHLVVNVADNRLAMTSTAAAAAAAQNRNRTNERCLPRPRPLPDSQLKVRPLPLGATWLSVASCKLQVCYHVHVHVHIHVRVRVHTSHNPQSSTSSFNNSFKWLCAIRLFAALPPLNASKPNGYSAWLREMMLSNEMSKKWKRSTHIASLPSLHLFLLQSVCILSQSEIQ